MRALFFDVFGTLVDWRTGVARESRAALAPLGYDLDWLAFADAWRAQYQPSLETVRSGARPFVKLDALHRETLRLVLPAFGVAPLDDAALDELTLAWHRLDAWPDVAEGLARLRGKFLLAPVSNGHISLMSALARRNGFHWDAILGAEHARNYKPRAEVYLAAADAFDLAPQDCAMVAAHTNDLVHAARLGLKTAHVARPDEHGPGKGERAPGANVDHAAQSLIELADKLV
ncbi:MAG: haloacid dehalogenase [Hyphomicrobiales bacterium]|nr:haloacid dehalogenase [Hyphomicrobiales bacterium]